MSSEIKTIADNQLPNTKGTLYTVPTSTSAAVDISCVNTHSSSLSINLYICRSGSSSRKIINSLSLQASGGKVIISGIKLSASDKIEGDAAIASKVDYVICGVERT